VQQAGAYLLKAENWSVSFLEQLHKRLLPISWFLTVLAFLSVYRFSSGQFPSFEIIIIIFVFAVSRLFLEYRAGIILSLGRMDLFNCLNVARATFDALGVLIVFELFGASIEKYLISILISYLFSCFLQEKMLSKLRSYDLINSINFLDIEKIGLKGLAYAFPLFIMGINYNADVMMLSFFGVPQEEIGAYAISVSLSTMIWMMPKVANIAIFSHSLNIRSSDKKIFSLKLMKYSLLLTLFISVITLFVFFLFAERLIVLLYGKQFSASYAALGWLLPGTILMLVFKLLNGNLAALGRPDIALKIFSFTGILNLCLNAVLIPWYGILGAAVASSASYSLGALVFLGVYRHIALSLRV